MSFKQGDITPEMIASLTDAKRRWDERFSRHGLTCDMNHASNIAFARVVEREAKVGNQVDFPIARQMFMLGYMTAEALKP